MTEKENNTNVRQSERHQFLDSLRHELRYEELICLLLNRHLRQIAQSCIEVKAVSRHCKVTDESSLVTVDTGTNQSAELGDAGV